MLTLKKNPKLHECIFNTNQQQIMKRTPRGSFPKQMLSTLHCSLSEQEKEKSQLSYCCWIIFLSISFMTEKFLRKQQILLVEYYRNNICDCPRKDLWLFFPEYHQKLRIYQQNFHTEMTSYILSFPYFRWVSTGNTNSSAW